MQRLFFDLLSKFYRFWRYDRYSLESAFDYKKEKDGLIFYLKKHAKDFFEYDEVFDVVRNNKKTKKFFCKQITIIARTLYNSISTEARRLNIYTYELRYDSKAAKIFLGDDFGFENEDIVLKELLIYLINAQDKGLFKEIIREIEPLDFDYACMEEYIEAIKKPIKRTLIYEEIEVLYEGIENKNDRKNSIDVFDYANQIIFSEDDEG